MGFDLLEAHRHVYTSNQSPTLQGSAPAQNHTYGAGKKSSAWKRSACITDEPGYAKACVFRKLYDLALLVEFIEMVTLRRFNCRAEKDQTVFGQKVGDGLEERLWILQMLREHCGNNPLILSSGRSLFHGKSVLHLEPDTAGVS
jgi:hypothetical protein